MSELENETDVEAEAFTDELCDEALDREGQELFCINALCGGRCRAGS